MRGQPSVYIYFEIVYIFLRSVESLINGTGIFIFPALFEMQLL
jgi:hypothetical protein